jgi:hypothetical protein
MSSRLDESWLMVASHQTVVGDRCVDVFAQPDGTFGFEEFCRDPEDMRACTPVAHFSGHEYPTQARAVEAAPWLVSWLVSWLVAVLGG